MLDCKNWHFSSIDHQKKRGLSIDSPVPDYSRLLLRAQERRVRITPTNEWNVQWEIAHTPLELMIAEGDVGKKKGRAK